MIRPDASVGTIVGSPPSIGRGEPWFDSRRVHQDAEDGGLSTWGRDAVKRPTTSTRSVSP